MDFYTMLNKYYDDIFKTKQKAMACIQGEVPLMNGTTLLDLAAGTGAEALALAEAGYAVTATDINDVMVSSMGEKAADRNVDMDVMQLDMTKLTESGLKDFDGIYCIGNSLVHLKDKDEMVHVLDAAYDALVPDGKLVVQTVNYDRIFAEKITSLPVIKNEEKGLVFERFYHFDDAGSGTSLVFEMKLTVEEEDEREPAVYRNRTSLVPLVKEDFVSLAERSKFGGCMVYGDFEKNLFTGKAPALVGVLTK